MTPTEEINLQLSAVRHALAGQLDPESPTFDSDANTAFNLLELWARQHAHQMETREEYISRIEARAARADTLEHELEVLKGNPAANAARRAQLTAQANAIADELADLEKRTR